MKYAIGNANIEFHLWFKFLIGSLSLVCLSPLSKRTIDHENLEPIQTVLGGKRDYSGTWI